MIELALSTGEPVQLKAAPLEKLRGTRLPGSQLQLAERDGYAISLQHFIQDLFAISYRVLNADQDLLINTREEFKGIRLETVLTGHLNIREASGKTIELLAGQYHLTETPFFQTQIKKEAGCSYFAAYFTSEMFNSIALNHPIETTAPRLMPAAMKELIYGILDNPYDKQLRQFYYENCLREIMFIHLTTPIINLKGELTEAEMAAVNEADRIIAENLNDHFTIRELARKAGTNAFVLKKGFQQMFGVGVFGRLLFRRMEKAKQLLASTNKPIKDITELAGYETVAGFITAFRKRFGLTPKDWRKQNRGT